MPIFEKGNKMAEKWTEDKAVELFESMLTNTIDDKRILSVQQAYIDFRIPCSTYYYLLEKFTVLEFLKKGISDIIIARINSAALKGERAGGFNATASIWRMKQLGERDQQYQDLTTKGQSLNDISELTTEELIARAEATKAIE